VIALLAASLLALATPSQHEGSRVTSSKEKPALDQAGKPSPPTHVEADNIEYLYKEHRTIMTGKPLVTLVRQDATLVCKKLVADNDAEGDIQHAECFGDVKLTRGDKYVTCQHATYDAEAGKIVCRGEPVLHDGPSILHCEEVVYDLETDRVLAQRGKGTVYQKPGQKLPGAKDHDKGQDAEERAK